MILKYYFHYLCLLYFYINHGQANDICDGWERYGNEKCFKVLDGTMLYYVAAVAKCWNMTQGSSLAVIRSQEEQDFLTNYLFTTKKIVDTVWLGAQVEHKQVTWVDSTKGGYENWQDGRPLDTNQQCVQMQPEAPNLGKWVDEPCHKNNLVVCQRVLPWTEDIIRDKIMKMQQQLDDMKKEIMPVGMLYTQLPGQPDPITLWPTMTWDNVTPLYAGLFFRAEGGNASQFDIVQEENSPRLTMVQEVSNGETTPYNHTLVSGAWSDLVYTGQTGGTNNWNLKFMVSGGEVRPRNQAIRVWKRVK